jgi:hypothetical protein
MNPDPVQIRVLREDGMWRIRYDDVVLDYESHDRALAASIELARTFGREGRFSAVVMGMITSHYGPGGFIQTIPNRKKLEAMPPPAEELPSAPHPLDSLIEVDSGPLVPDAAPEPVAKPSPDRRRKPDEKQPRLLQIASALAAVDKP